MNIAEYALKNRILVVAVLICLVVGGAFAYNSMSKLEDPEIKVKVAVVATGGDPPARGDHPQDQ